MTEENEGSGIEIVPKGDEWVFRKYYEGGETKEVDLSDDEILALSTHILRLQKELLERRSKPGLQGRAVLPIERIDLAADAHGTSVLLSCFGPGNQDICLALPLALAKQFSEKLPQAVSEIEKLVSGRTTQ